MKHGYKRLQFDFSNDAIAKIEEVEKITEAASKAEVIRNALRFYDYSIRMMKDSYNIEFTKNGERITIPSALVISSTN